MLHHQSEPSLRTCWLGAIWDERSLLGNVLEERANESLKIKHFRSVTALRSSHPSHGAAAAHQQSLQGGQGRREWRGGRESGKGD